MSTARLNILISHLKQYIKDHPNKDIQISFGGTVEMVAEIGSMIVGGPDLERCAECHIIIICYMIFFPVLYSRHTRRNTAFLRNNTSVWSHGILNISLDYITATLTGISIGAGTDYTAYFLWRLRERSFARGDLEKGYVDTMTSIARELCIMDFLWLSGFLFLIQAIFLPIRFSAS